MNANGLEFILILLVPLGVWIFSSIFKSDDERPAARAAPGSRPSPQRRPVTDLERFLEEARRRRELAEKRQAEESDKKARPAPRAESRANPLPERRTVRPAPPQPARRSVDSPIARTVRAPVLLEAIAEPLPTVVPAARTDPPRADVPRSETVVLPVQVPVAMLVEPLAPAARVGPATKAPSPALVQLAQLLQSPRSAGTAIVLREIFDRPLCRRGR
jgi:hypothetical protein